MTAREQAITDLKEARATHVEWEQLVTPDTAHLVGDAAHHRRWIARYNQAIRVLQACE